MCAALTDWFSVKAVSNVLPHFMRIETGWIETGFLRR